MVTDDLNAFLNINNKIARKKITGFLFGTVSKIPKHYEKFGFQAGSENGFSSQFLRISCWSSLIQSKRKPIKGRLHAVIPEMRANQSGSIQDNFYDTMQQVMEHIVEGN